MGEAKSGQEERWRAEGEQGRARRERRATCARPRVVGKQFQVGEDGKQLAAGSRGARGRVGAEAKLGPRLPDDESLFGAGSHALVIIILENYHGNISFSFSVGVNFINGDSVTDFRDRDSEGERQRGERVGGAVGADQRQVPSDPRQGAR